MFTKFVHCFCNLFNKVDYKKVVSISKDTSLTCIKVRVMHVNGSHYSEYTSWSRGVVRIWNERHSSQHNSHSSAFTLGIRQNILNFFFYINNYRKKILGSHLFFFFFFFFAICLIGLNLTINNTSEIVFYKWIILSINE